MAHKRWVVNLDGREHVIELDHGFWSGRRVIKVDGAIIVRARKVFDTGSVHEFPVSGHQCVVVINTSVLPVRYALYVDGTIVDAPSAVSPRGRMLLGAAGVLALMALAYVLAVLAPTTVPRPEQLLPLSGTVTERSVSGGRYEETLYFKLDGADLRLWHRSYGAHYASVKRGLSAGDAITVWVAEADLESGDDARVWQVRKGQRMLLRYGDQAEVAGMWNTLFRAGGVAALFGALYLAWRWMRRVFGSPSKDVRPHLRTLEPVVPRAVVHVLVAASGFVALWCLCAGAVRALELDASQLGWLLGLAQASVFLLPASSVYEKHGMPGRLESWSFGLLWLMALLLYALESWYYIPPEVLSRHLGADVAAAVAPLALLFSGPSVAIALPSLVPYLMGGSDARRLLLGGLWLAGLATAGISATLGSQVLVVWPWLAVGTAAATWSLLVALRLVEWTDGVRKAGTAARDSAARRPAGNRRRRVRDGLALLSFGLLALAVAGWLQPRGQQVSYVRWLESKTYVSSLETPLFSLHADVPQAEARLIARHLEDFARAVAAERLVPAPAESPHVPVYLLREQDWPSVDPTGSAYGFFDGERIVVNLDLGLGTANFAVVHSLLASSDLILDDFDANGLAMAFEKTITFYSAKQSQPAVSFGYLHPRRTNYALEYIDREIGDDHQKGAAFLLSIGDKREGARAGAGSYDVVATLFNRMLREGRLPRYVALLGSGLDRKSRLEMAFEKPLDAIWAEHVAWLRACPMDPDFGLVSATFVAEGGDAPSVNGRPLRYDPQVRRWTFR